jgi:dsDNA-binding SOS-regulon protein
MLDSGFYENQVWGALHKAWKGYIIAKTKDEYDKMLHYADIIQECQDDLGLQVCSFDDTCKSALAFHSLRAWQIAQKNN